MIAPDPLDEKFLRQAIVLGRKAARLGEVPVGAVVVGRGVVLGRGHNRRETSSDPTNHAEIAALRQAARRLQTWRLDECSLYVTLEPCPMCAGACVNARIERIVYGCADPKAGYVATLGRIASDPRLNHRCRVQGGVLAAECGDLLTEFFRERRRGTRAKPATGR
jgi:tRNA(adenine34) deaminase